MGKTVNFGVDLGTTNSLIAKYNAGKVEIFKNPNGHKENLPSVVGFRNNRIIVGDKAREFIQKDQKNTVSSFKRKMGTNEKFYIPSLGRDVSPIELSSFVLKELKNFVHTNDPVDELVITIPASFDTVQSNATKESGLAAGFINIYLLQEPIAACLAYFNETAEQNIKSDSGYWMVYDLGGGTFDVALIKLYDGELKVVDHQGDNYLGGMDFDSLIVDKLIAPHLLTKGTFLNLNDELKTSAGKYNSLYYKLLKIAEEAKVLLSTYETAEIEFDTEDDNGNFIDIYFSIERSQFETLIAEQVNETIAFTNKIIDSNELKPEQINEILLVGGSTYIPYVRQTLSDKLGLPVNHNIDPTSAVAIGAGYYAGTKTILDKVIHSLPTPEGKEQCDFTVKMAYQKVTQETEEYFAAKIDGEIENNFFRILRKDGGFDSGLKQLDTNISEILPLITGEPNNFTLNIYNQTNKCLYTSPDIQIVNGKYSITGQPLPEDICIELDDPQNNSTRLEVVFAKNSILPIRKTITKELTRSINMGDDESIIIHILEGPQMANPMTNKPIGAIEISGEKLTRNITKRSDIEITLEMSESRNLKVMAYVAMSDQEFIDIFNPSERHVNVSKLKDEIETLRAQIRDEINKAQRREQYEIAAQLLQSEEDINLIYAQANQLKNNDVTDLRYQLEDKKRRLYQSFDNITRNHKLTAIAQDYFEQKKGLEEVLEENGTEQEKLKYERLISDEKLLISGGNPKIIERKTNEIRNLKGQITWRMPQMVILYFLHFKMLEYPNQDEANKHIANGEDALSRQNYDELRIVVNMLATLLPDEKKNIDLKGTGIG